MHAGKNKQKEKVSRRDLFRSLFRGIKGGESLKQESSGMDPDMVYADKLLKKGDYQGAEHYYARRLEKEPMHVEAMRNLGYCLFKMGELDRARKSWESLLSLRPRDNHALLYVGLIHAYQGSTKQAVDTWKLYFNIRKPLVQREINLILARHERGDELDPEKIASQVAEAIEKMERG